MVMRSYREPTSKSKLPSNFVTIFSIGGLSTALLASVCCIGPLVFVALGVGVGATGLWVGTAEFLKGLLPFRPVFIGLTIFLLSTGFYLAYRKSESMRCALGEVCAEGNPNTRNRTYLWIMASLALILVLAPYWLGL